MVDCSENNEIVLRTMPCKHYYLDTHNGILLAVILLYCLVSEWAWG